jgi:outer membrane lipoprotein-sorting protein
MIEEKDVIIVDYKLAVKEVSKLFAELFTQNARFQDRPDLHERTDAERIINRQYGNIAVLSVASWLLENGKFVRIYDMERNEFNTPDNWDLLVKNKNGDFLKVEVKSSGPADNTKDLKTCLEYRRLAIKPGEQKDINIQSYFLPTDHQNRVYLISWTDKSKLDLMYSNGEVETYGGGEERKVFKAKLNEYVSLNKLLEYLI